MHVYIKGGTNTGFNIIMFNSQLVEQLKICSDGASLRDFKAADVQSFSTGKLIYEYAEISSREYPYLLFLGKEYLNRNCLKVCF
jgi:hypothetical protein